MRKLLLLIVLFSLLMAGNVLAQDALPTLGDLDAGWNEIALGVEAVCARGDAYRFLVHPGDPNKLAVFFQGGGACWNADTCKEGGPFSDDVRIGNLDRYGGIFDFANAENPLAAYSFVIITYCTGDVHTGTSTQDFRVGTTDFSINFSGFTNAQAVLEWTYANFENPTDVIVAGSSAGAYGASFNAPGILEHYADARVVVFGDAGIGVTQPDWEGLITWNSAANVPDYVKEAEGVNLNDQLYTALAEQFPQASFAQYTSYSDQIQSGFYTLQGGAEEDWVMGVQNSLNALNELPNFRSYVGWGGTHTILATPLFYGMQVNGVRFRDWFADLVSGEMGAVENIACEDCQLPELYTGE